MGEYWELKYCCEQLKKHDWLVRNFAGEKEVFIIDTEYGDTTGDELNFCPWCGSRFTLTPPSNSNPE